MTTTILASSIIFLSTFILILTERFHRTTIALAGATAMVVVGTILHFYLPHQAVEAIDFNTIGLLFGMMILIVILEKTGLFQYLGIFTAKKTKGNPWLLLVALGGLTSILSMILDNVTTIVLIAPVTIIVTRMLGINPAPILLAEAILSNVGGTATLVGDPPNIMIGSAASFSFNDFLIHSLPVVIVAWIATIIIFRIFFKKDLSQKPSSIEKLLALKESDAITDWPMLKRSLVILALVVSLFFLHSTFHLEPAVVALIGAALGLIAISAKKDPQPILEKTELSVLLFFGALFVLVGGLEHAGVLEMISTFLLSGAEGNILLTALIILWASAALSAIVDNIPLTVAMIPIIGVLGTQGVDVDLIWWALVFGVGFGGNGSPIGSSAGVIIMSKSEQTDNPITFKQWLATGLPATFVALCVASVAIVIFSTTGLV